MKRIIILSVCVIACTAQYYELPEDNYNEEQLENDDVELRSRTDCLLERGPCSTIMAAYKKITPDALNTACARCSPKLKSLTHTYFNSVRKKFPADYRALIMKYDTNLSKYSALERAVGVLETVLSNLPSVPALPSLQNLPSLQALPLPSLQTLPSEKSSPAVQSLPSLPSLGLGLLG